MNSYRAVTASKQSAAGIYNKKSGPGKTKIRVSGTNLSLNDKEKRLIKVKNHEDRLEPIEKGAKGSVTRKARIVRRVKKKRSSNSRGPSIKGIQGTTAVKTTKRKSLLSPLDKVPTVLGKKYDEYLQKEKMKTRSEHDLVFKKKGSDHEEAVSLYDSTSMPFVALPTVPAKNHLKENWKQFEFAPFVTTDMIEGGLWAIVGASKSGKTTLAENLIFRTAPFMNSTHVTFISPNPGPSTKALASVFDKVDLKNQLTADDLELYRSKTNEATQGMSEFRHVALFDDNAMRSKKDMGLEKSLGTGSRWFFSTVFWIVHEAPGQIIEPLRNSFNRVTLMSKISGGIFAKWTELIGSRMGVEADYIERIYRHYVTNNKKAMIRIKDSGKDAFIKCMPSITFDFDEKKIYDFSMNEISDFSVKESVESDV